MAICNLCNKEMLAGVSCGVKYLKHESGISYVRSTYHFDEPDGYCHDCKAPHGETHHLGCDVERCPICGNQVISCSCFKEY